MRARAVLLALVACAASLCACSQDLLIATGESDDLVIMTDPDVTPRAEEALVALAHTTVPWLLDEESYKTTVAPASGRSGLLGRRHVLLAGVWGRGEVPRLVERRLAAPRAGEPATFRIEDDAWARGQVVGTLLGRDEEELLAYIRAHREEILSRLEDAVVGRLTRTLLDDPDGAAAGAMLGKRYGWSLAPPTGYDLISGAAGQGFVYLRRTQPDRNIFVRWIPGDSTNVTREFAVSVRQEMTRRYYDGDEIEMRRPFAVDTAAFGGRRALRISGWWANQRLLGGGPFRLWCFAVPEQGRVYIVDVSLFAPGLDKVPLMRNLEAIAGTFAAPPPTSP